MKGVFQIWTVLIFAVGTIDALSNTCSSGPQRSIAHCIRRHGKEFAETYCASILSVTASTVKTTTTIPKIITIDTIETTKVIAVSGTPPLNETTAITKTANTTKTFTQTETIFTATAISSVTSISVSTAYTCGIANSTKSTRFHNTTIPGSGHQPSAGFPSFSVTGSNPSVPHSARNHSSVRSTSSGFPRSQPSSRMPGSHSSRESTRPTAPGTPLSTHNVGDHTPLGSTSSKATGRHPSETSSAEHHPPIGSISLSATGSHPSASIHPSGSHGSNFSVTAHRSPPVPPACSYDLPPPYTTHAKRQASPVSTLRCLRKYQRTAGAAAISEACECFSSRTPKPVTSTVTVTNSIKNITSTRTTQVDGTTTLIPTKTNTHLETTNVTKSTTKVVTISTEKIVISTVVSTSTITKQSPTPSSFVLLNPAEFTNSTHQEPPYPYFAADKAPGGSGIVVAPRDAADRFRLDSAGRLVDITAGSQFIARNAEDLYPFQLLRTRAATSNTPICSVCDGILQCDYPGTSGNTFARCYGYLALGPKNVFGEDSDLNGDIDCMPFNLVILDSDDV